MDEKPQVVCKDTVSAYAVAFAVARDVITLVKKDSPQDAVKVDAKIFNTVVAAGNGLN